jgi:hypothetical protein
MNRKSVMIGFILSCVIVLGSGKAEAGQLPLKGSFSGTFVNTQIDTNGDGQKAGFNSVGAKGTLGSSTIQGVNEFVFSGPATCPNGNAGFGFTLLRSLNPAAPSNFVQRFESTGDLIFSEETSGTICFDPATLIQFFSVTSEITGGTGRFEGATGTGEASGTAKTLFEDAAGNFFGEQSGTYTATITTP